MASMIINKMIKVVSTIYFKKDKTRNNYLVFLKANSDESRLIGLQAINQILIEMTYSAKRFNPAINRRVSISFREAQLRMIFENVLNLTKNTVDHLTNMVNTGQG